MVLITTVRQRTDAGQLIPDQNMLQTIKKLSILASVAGYGSQSFTNVSVQNIAKFTATGML
jgi:hypothetical protein